MNSCRVPDHNLDYDESLCANKPGHMKSIFKKEMFESLEFIERWEPNTWTPGYLIPNKDLEHAADHLMGIYEKFHDNASLMWHLEEVFSSLDIPLPK